MITTSAICLALAIYWEARNQPVEGQLAVAYVVLDRVYAKNFPDNECAVVYQPDQFSFYSDGKSDEPLELEAWKKAKGLAIAAKLIYKPGWANHYHTRETVTDWSICLAPVKVIGDHVFFKL